MPAGMGRGNPNVDPGMAKSTWGLPVQFTSLAIHTDCDDGSHILSVCTALFVLGFGYLCSYNMHLSCIQMWEAALVHPKDKF
jgi:hypothetical protein